VDVEILTYQLLSAMSNVHVLLSTGLCYTMKETDCVFSGLYMSGWVDPMQEMADSPVKSKNCCSGRLHFIEVAYRVL